MPEDAGEERLAAVAELPARYREIVVGIRHAQRLLSASAVTKGGTELLVLRKTSVRTKIFLASRQQRVVFLFRRPTQEEVILDVDLDFDVAPVMEPEPDAEAPRIFASQPPFFGTELPLGKKRALAAALDEKDLGKLLFVDLRNFQMAAKNAEDHRIARVAFLFPGAVEPIIAYQNVGGLQADQVRIRYNPLPFRVLLDQVGRWATEKFRSSIRRELVLPKDSELAVQDVVRALADGWRECRDAATASSPNDPLAPLIPAFAASNYRAEVTLRLESDGTLAEKNRDDAFRLRLSLRAASDAIDLTVGPPDFLSSGELHDRLIEATLEEDVIRRLFDQSGLLKQDRPQFESFVRDAAARAWVFRAKKEGDTDTELFVFRGDWRGSECWLITMLAVQVRFEGGEPSVEADRGSASIVLLDNNFGSPNPPEPTIEFPAFMLSLLNQLNNWQRAFG